MFFHKVLTLTSGWLQEKVKTSSVILLIFPHNDFFAEICNFCFLNTASAYDNKPLLGNQQQCCLKVNLASLKKRCGKALRSGNLQNHHELIAYNFICLILNLPSRVNNFHHLIHKWKTLDITWGISFSFSPFSLIF